MVTAQCRFIEALQAIMRLTMQVKGDNLRLLVSPGGCIPPRRSARVPKRRIRAATNGKTCPIPTTDEALYLIHRYTLATSCVLDLFDEGELLRNLLS